MATWKENPKNGCFSWFLRRESKNPTPNWVGPGHLFGDEVAVFLKPCLSKA